MRSFRLRPHWVLGQHKVSAEDTEPRLPCAGGAPASPKASVSKSTCAQRARPSTWAPPESRCQCPRMPPPHPHHLCHHARQTTRLHVPPALWPMGSREKTKYRLLRNQHNSHSTELASEGGVVSVCLAVSVTAGPYRAFPECTPAPYPPLAFRL